MYEVSNFTASWTLPMSNDGSSPFKPTSIQTIPFNPKLLHVVNHGISIDLLNGISVLDFSNLDIYILT